MKTWGHDMQVYIGIWVIIGLVVLGVNGYAFISLVDEPLAGYSPGVQQTDRGLQQYRQMLSAKSEKLSSGLELLAQRFTATVPKHGPPEAVDQKKAPVKVAKRPTIETVSLPVLAGIVTSRSAAGRVHRLALLDSGIYSEGETFQDFTIRKISADGVLLSKGKQSWFIERPKITYSVSQH